MLNVPLHCSRLADWSVTLKMTLPEPQNRGLATFPENKIRDSRFSQVFPERSAMQEKSLCGRSAERKCDSECVVRRWVFMDSCTFGVLRDIQMFCIDCGTCDRPVDCSVYHVSILSMPQVFFTSLTPPPQKVCKLKVCPLSKHLSLRSPLKIHTTNISIRNHRANNNNVGSAAVRYLCQPLHCNVAMIIFFCIRALPLLFLFGKCAMRLVATTCQVVPIIHESCAHKDEQPIPSCSCFVLLLEIFVS